MESAVAWDSTTASLSGIAWARKSAAIWESGSADILKLGSIVAVVAVGSSVAVAGAGDGTVFVSHDWGVLATWTQPGKPEGELAQPTRSQLPTVDGAVGRRGVKVLVETPEEEEVMVALVIGVAVDIMLVELMVLFKPMLLEVVDGHSVGMTMRLTTSHPAGTLVPLVP